MTRRLLHIVQKEKLAPLIAAKNARVIDGLHLTSWRPCSIYNTKEYDIINSIVGSSRRGWLTLSAISREIDYKRRIEVAELIASLVPYTYNLNK